MKTRPGTTQLVATINGWPQGDGGVLPALTRKMGHHSCKDLAPFFVSSPASFYLGCPLGGGGADGSNNQRWGGGIPGELEPTSPLSFPNEYCHLFSRAQENKPGEKDRARFLTTQVPGYKCFPTGSGRKRHLSQNVEDILRHSFSLLKGPGEALQSA